MSKKRRPVLKIAGISLLSILGVVIVAALLLIWTVLSPARLTSVSRKAIDRFVPCRTELDTVRLSLAGGFPFLGLDLDGLVVYDEMEESPYDTLLHVGKLGVKLDVKALYKNKDIIVTGLSLQDADANLYISETGKTNLDFLSSDTLKEEEPEDSTMNFSLDVKNVILKDISASYSDNQSGLHASVLSLEGHLDGKMTSDTLEADVFILTKSPAKVSISNDSTDLNAVVDGVLIRGNVNSYDGLKTIASNCSVSAGDANIIMDSIEAAVSSLLVSTPALECRINDNGMNLSVSDLSASGKIDASIGSEMNAGVQVFQAKFPQLTYTESEAVINGMNLSLSGAEFLMTDSTGGRMNASFDDLTATGNARMTMDDSCVDEDIILTVNGLSFNMNGETSLAAAMKDLRLNLVSGIGTDTIKVNPVLETSALEFASGTERLVPGWPVKLTANVLTNRELSRVRMPGKLTVNGQNVGFDTDVRLSDDMSDIAGWVSVDAPSLNIDRVVSMLPDSVKAMLDGIDVHGGLGLKAKANGAISNGNMQLDNAVADVSLSNIDATVADTMHAESPKLHAKVSYPSSNTDASKGESADVRINADNLLFSMSGATNLSAKLAGVDLDVSAAGLTDSIDRMSAVADIKLGSLQAIMDTIELNVDDLAANGTLTPSDGLPAMMLAMDLGDLATTVGSALDASIGRTSLTAMARYDETKDDVLLKWNPRVKFEIEDGYTNVSDVDIELPVFDVDFSLGRFLINDSRIVMGNSDMSFWGEVYNIGAYIEHTGLLTGELFLESDFVDVNQIMELTSGMGDEDAQQTAQQMADELEAGNDTVSASAFLVPKGIDLTMYTNFAEIAFGDHSFNNVGGDVTVKDGTAVLQELGFSSNAAEMQLTAIYRSPSLDSLFMEMDFHLIDIEIDELIDLIPSVDSIVPMLKSFKGQAQFHLAAETYLKPDYTPRMSTLLGAAAIEGKDLVVLDSEVFDGMKRKLLMSKKAKNVIDSLDVELQVIRNKVTLYPFKLSMDKYTAVAGGRHNINKSLDCSYHVSLIETPLPIRLGVTVSGPIFDITDKPLKHIKLTRPQYDKLFEPEKRSDVEDQVIRLKSGILETLRSNVR